LALAYQPIFHGADARLCGFEALARWNHPTRGRLTATEFVDAAAESGVIVQIGRWVMTEACRQLADWHDAYPDSGPLRVAINLCERELLDPHFAASVESALAASGLPASSLVLEMTEHALMTHGELAVPALRDRSVVDRRDRGRCRESGGGGFDGGLRPGTRSRRRGRRRGDAGAGGDAVGNGWLHVRAGAFLRGARRAGRRGCTDRVGWCW
jgi:hypothetical protein